MPVISLTDRRAAGNRLVRFVYQRHLEAILYGRAEGSSGPIYKLLASSGMGSTTLTVKKQAVTDGTITQDEYTAIMSAFKAALPASVVDPSSLGRIRNCTIFRWRDSLVLFVTSVEEVAAVRYRAKLNVAIKPEERCLR